MLMLTMAFHIIDALEMFECELFVHLAWTHKNQGPDEIQAGLSFIKTEALTIRLASYLIADLVLWTWKNGSKRYDPGISLDTLNPRFSGKMVT